MIVLDGRTEVARHERSTRKGSQIPALDHYLEVLSYKPGALPGATALVQARANGAFTTTNEAFWAVARKTGGDSAGTRALIEILLMHRHMNHATVVADRHAALSVGITTPMSSQWRPASTGQERAGPTDWNIPKFTLGT